MLIRGILLALSVLLAGAANAQFLVSGTITTSTGSSTTRAIPATGAPVGATPGGGLTIPAAAFKLSGFAFRTFSFSPSIAQVASSFTSSNASVMLAPGGGPGAFSWCPQGNIPCSDPDQFSTVGGFHGLLVYSAGGGYGGTFQVMRNITNASLARLVSGTTNYSHSSPNANTNPWGGGLPASQTQVTIATMPKIVTSGAVLGPQGSIQSIGLTTTGPGTMINQVGTSSPTPTRFVTGFPATTGMIFAWDRSGAGASMHSWTGSDNRNANGNGAITLVASGYSNNLQGETFPHRLTVAMTIAPPVPSMDAVGMASLGVLLVAGGAYFIRRHMY